MRDYQKNKVYKSENIVLPFFEDTMTFEDAKHLCFEIVNSDFLKYLYDTYDFITPPSKDFYVYAGDRRYKYAQSNNTKLCLPEGTRNLPTILHELAHVLTITDANYESISFHGREFCFTYLTLLKKYMGSDFEQDLIQTFQENKVDFTVDSIPPHTKI